MTAADVAGVERELGVALPAAYRAALLAPPFDEPRGDCLYWFFTQAADVLDATRFLLADGDYDGAGWEPTFVGIGFSPCGDVYLLDTAEPDGPVRYLCHESHEIRVDYPSFAAFVHAYAADHPAAAADRQAADAAGRRAWTRWNLKVAAAAVGLPALAAAVLAAVCLTVRAGR